MPPSLESTFASAWKHYAEAFTRAKKAASEKNIHGLRVSTQKFEAALSLADGLICSREPQNLIKELRKTRKRIGRLRDLQVETKKFHATNNTKLKTFLIYIDAREIKFRKKSLRCLREVDLELQKKSARKIRVELSKFEKNKRASDIRIQAEKTVRVVYEDFKKTVTDPRKMRLKDIHHARILVKRLRYQGTILQSVFGSHHLDLKRLKAAQELVGKIQDEHKLQRSMEKFLNKGRNRGQTGVLRACRRIEKNKVKLIHTKVRNLSAIKWQS